MFGTEAALGDGLERTGSAVVLHIESTLARQGIGKPGSGEAPEGCRVDHRCRRRGKAADRGDPERGDDHLRNGVHSPGGVRLLLLRGSYPPAIPRADGGMWIAPRSGSGRSSPDAHNTLQYNKLGNGGPSQVRDGIFVDKAVDDWLAEKKKPRSRERPGFSETSWTPSFIDSIPSLEGVRSWGAGRSPGSRRRSHRILPGTTSGSRA